MQKPLTLKEKLVYGTLIGTLSVFTGGIMSSGETGVKPKELTFQEKIQEIKSILQRNGKTTAYYISESDGTKMVTSIKFGEYISFKIIIETSNKASTTLIKDYYPLGLQEGDTYEVDGVITGFVELDEQTKKSVQELEEVIADTVYLQNQKIPIFDMELASR